MLTQPVNLAMHVIDNLGQYERIYSSFQPEILMGENPSDIATLLRKNRNSRSSKDQQDLNAWKHWRQSVIEAEGKNETSLRMLFRSLVIFNREIENAKDETQKSKYSECIALITSFLFDIWDIPNAMEYVIAGNYLSLTKTFNRVPGMSDEWRDPIGNRND